VCCACSVPALNLTSDTGLTRAQNDPMLVSSTAFSSPGILIETKAKDGAINYSYTGEASRLRWLASWLVHDSIDEAAGV